ncbi:MAG: sulfotransferase [Longimicrobiales bacterium]|nr:sulfotransferase [Longimicrobiales bacterium]
MVFIPVFLLVQTVHWVCLLLDDLLFPAYRRAEVEAPLFVVGIPRSGTTFLHRVLARDPRFTTPRLWELVLAPSIVQRKAVRMLGRIDGWVGRPLGRLVRRMEGRLFRALDDVHPVTLDAPEEDYFALLPAFACFLLVLPFPGHPAVWELARFDELPEATRRRVMAFYRSILQRHVFVHGQRTVLSKNPSFSPMIRSLRQEFPDARFVFCVRDPLEAVPSLISSLRGGAAFFGWDPTAAEHTDRFLEMLRYYTEHALDTLPGWPAEVRAFVPMAELTEDVRRGVVALYERFGWTPTAGFRAALAEEHERSRRYTSGHRYALEEVGLTAGEIRARLHRMIRHFDYGAPEPEAVGG